MELAEYTEQLMERAKARKEYLSKKLAEAKKRGNAMSDDNESQDLNSAYSDDSPKRQCLDPESRSEQYDETMSSSESNYDNKENEYEDPEDGPPIPFGMRGLAALQKKRPAYDGGLERYNNDPGIDEPKESQGFVKSPSKAKLLYDFSKNKVQIHEEESIEEEEVDMDYQQEDSEYDSVDEKVMSRKNENVQNLTNQVKSPVKPLRNSPVPIKPVENKSPIKPLEKKSPLKPVESKSPNKLLVEKNPAKPSEMITAKTVNQIKSNDELNTSFDPVQLPLSARKALFENAFNCGMPKSSDPAIEQNLSVAQRAAMFEKASKSSGQSNVPKKTYRDPPKSTSMVSPGMKINTVVAPRCNSDPQPPPNATQTCSIIITKPSSPAKRPSPEAVLSPSKAVGTHTRLIHQQLVENSSSDWRKKDVVAKACTERKNEISALLNHWEKVSSSSADGGEDLAGNNYKKSSSSESEKYESVFPEEDEDDSSESEKEKEDGSYSENEEQDNGGSGSNSSMVESESAESGPASGSYEVFSREESRSCNSDSTRHGSISSDAVAVCNEMDNILDNVLDPDCAVMPPPCTPTSIHVSRHLSSRSSSEESCCSASGSTSSQSHLSDTGYRTPQIQSAEESEKDLPLLHTVSFYRRQKQEKRATPVRTIVRRPEVASPPSPEVDQSKQIQERIKALQDEIFKQQTHIGQTSQALNRCHETENFYGSTEQVEAEKVLLIATQKRMACLNEIQRLKSQGLNHKNEGKGTLILHDIKLPLKKDFILSHTEGKAGDVVHYFMCIVRYEHQVIVTQMLSAQDGVKTGSLCFTNHITLHNLSPDFSVAFEVYALQTKKEVLPHDKKYHIKRDHSKLRLTPKGKKSDSTLLSPAVSSPGGPNAVRTPSFAVVGFTRFTIQNCNREICTLEKVPFSSPLEGLLKLKMQLHAEHAVVERGFLTMFDDVSGFGAWHRRWGVLDGKDMAFWKYPDDEKRKEPLLVIDLKQCITREVKPVSRDVCARPHTFELLTVRPQAKGDKNTLISRSVNTLTTTKYLLSADTKEERILWCKRLNDALTNARKWDPNALRPIERKDDR